MRENIILDKSETINKTTEGTNQENFSQIRSRKNKVPIKEKECKVIRYNKFTKMLDVNFEGHGIRIKNVDNFVGDTAIIKYKSEIGKPDFEYKL